MSLVGDGDPKWHEGDESAKPDWWPCVETEIRKHLSTFGSKVQSRLQVSPEEIFVHKNPFLFRIRTTGNAQDLAESVISAYLSSSEETIFGYMLKNIALIICRAGRGGEKSDLDHIDLVYTWPDNVQTIVQVRSGLNWGNARQRDTMVESFANAVHMHKQRSTLQIRCVEGICYGKSEKCKLDKHWRISGASFWKEISAWEGAAQSIFKVVEEYASNGMQSMRNKAVNDMIEYFIKEGIATKEGEILWDKLFELAMGP